MSTRTLFDEHTALSKVGRQVRTLITFSGVPKDARGQVIRADGTGKGYTLTIQWELPKRRGKPLVDWFTRNEYQQYLAEL